MKQYRVVFSAAAQKDLASIEDYIEERFSLKAAVTFTNEILGECNELRTAPKRGLLRPELGENVRRIGAAKGRVAVMFRVEADEVVILGIRYTGPATRP
jgi:plasmid stabilization system protein ParE